MAGLIPWSPPTWHAAGLRLAPELRTSMQQHVQSLSPLEACGLVAGLLLPGEPARAIQVFLIPNILNSPYRFRMEGRAQLAAFQQIETSGLQLLAIFHSHPHGPSHPSETDIAEGWYPDTLTIILSPVEREWRLLAFSIWEKNYLNCPLYD